MIQMDRFREKLIFIKSLKTICSLAALNVTREMSDLAHVSL